MIPRRFLLCALAFAVTQVVAADTPFLRNALSGFDSWDSDQDGSLTIGEIEHAIASPEVKGERAAAVVALRRVARSRSNPVSAYTKDDIKRLSGTLSIDDSRDNEEDTDENRRGPANFDRYYSDALKKINSTRRDLFVGAPSLDGFKQGRLGSCFCLAPLSAMAYTDPKALTALFKPSADGSKITVTFGKNHPVEVTRLTDGEIALAATTGDNGVWAATYEKAVGQLRLADRNSDASPTPLSVVARGGSAGTMLSVLTGNAIQRFSCKPWFEDAKTPKAELDRKLVELRALLKSATADKRLMTAGTSGKTRKVPRLSRGHAYGVLGYDAKTDLVTIRDPHGQTFKPKGSPGLVNGYTINQGIFQAPLTEVVQFMAGFAFQLNTPAKTRGYGAASAATAVTD